MHTIGGCPACRKSRLVLDCGEVACDCGGMDLATLGAMAFCGLIIFVLIALAGCVPRLAPENAPDMIYITCEQQLRARDVRWAKALKDCRDNVDICEMMADEPCAPNKKKK